MSGTFLFDISVYFSIINEFSINLDTQRILKVSSIQLQHQYRYFDFTDINELGMSDCHVLNKKADHIMKIDFI